MTDEFTSNSLLIHAARISRKFHLDPLEVLQAPILEWLIRDAAYRVILDDEREQAEQMKAQSRKK